MLLIKLECTVAFNCVLKNKRNIQKTTIKSCDKRKLEIHKKIQDNEGSSNFQKDC